MQIFALYNDAIKAKLIKLEGDRCYGKVKTGRSK